MSSRRGKSPGSALVLFLLFCVFVLLAAVAIGSFVALRWLAHLILKGLLPSTGGSIDDLGIVRKAAAGAAAYFLFVGLFGLGAILADQPINPLLITGAALPFVGALLHHCWGWIKSLPLSVFRRPKKVDKRGLDPTLWSQARQRCFEQKGRRCLIKLRGCTKEATQIDHIRPLARGGEKYDVSNLQPACRFCNLSKGTKLMSELPRRRLFGGRRR